MCCHIWLYTLPGQGPWSLRSFEARAQWLPKEREEVNHEVTKEHQPQCTDLEVQEIAEASVYQADAVGKHYALRQGAASHVPVCVSSPVSGHKAGRGQACRAGRARSRCQCASLGKQLSNSAPQDTMHMLDGIPSGTRAS